MRWSLGCVSFEKEGATSENGTNHWKYNLLVLFVKLVYCSAGTTFMETPKPIQFIAERLKGGAWSKLAEIVTEACAEYVKPLHEMPRAPEPIEDDLRHERY